MLPNGHLDHLTRHLELDIGGHLSGGKIPASRAVSMVAHDFPKGRKGSSRIEIERLGAMVFVMP